ncbi:phage tail protein [Niallia taxi]|uniref:phage tail protein n=1 Tax=Niallia taxi TaxID=2499688 RepID=UPI0031784431
MLIVKNQKLEDVAILENAYGLSYEKTSNQIWSASFSLPLNDIKNNYCTSLSFLEIVDNFINESGEEISEYVGLFRIIPKTTVKNETDNVVNYELEHVLATLLDKQIFGYIQTVNKTTRYNLEYLLSQQNTKHWVLGEVEITRGFSYDFENCNLLSALFSIPKPFDVEMRWTWDTTSYPWILNLIKLETEPTCEIREGYNLIGLQVEENPNGIFNRIYPLGYGEGVNQLTISKVNNGVKYVEDTQSIGEYDVREYIWADKKYTDALTLKAAAESLLKKWKEPIVSWKTTVAELVKITGLSKDKFREGAIVRLQLIDFPATDVRIVRESKPDVTGQPWNVSLELGNLTDDIASTSSDLERRQQINELNTDGFTNLLTYSYNDNADSENPAEISIYIPEETVRLNKAILTYKTESFRAYERAIKGGGAIVKSTSGGGGTTATSSSGGGTTATSSSGGGTTATSSSGGGISTSTASGGGTSESSSAGGDHYHLMFEAGSSTEHDESMDKEFYANAQDGGGATARVVLGGTIANSLFTRGSSGNHSHNVTFSSHTHNFNVPNHTHNVTVPNHTHDVSVPNHTHTVTIPNHTHDITLPDHTHEIEFGIFKLQQLPTSVKLTIDGTVHSINSTSSTDLDLVPYLSKDGDGRVTRGWHTIEILPNSLGRIIAQIYTQFFISGQGGGDY